MFKKFGCTVLALLFMCGIASADMKYNPLTGKFDITGEVFYSTSLPSACGIGQMYWDTDADTDGSLYVCRAIDTWKEVDDDGGAGGGDLLADGSVPLSANWDVGNYDLTMKAATGDGVATFAGFTIGSAVIIEAELEMLDGITAGTAAASKALVLDASGDIATINSLTATTLVGALTGEASTAAALAADPNDCPANEFADVIAADGTLSCNGVVDADVSDTLTASIIDLEAGTVTNIATTEIMVGVGAGDASYVALSGDATMANDGVVSVVWGNIAEGELADSTVIGADIKNDTIDSDDYAAASIDAEHLAADIITHALMADADQTDTKCIWFEDPTADDDFNSIWTNKTANDLLITEIWCESDQTIDFDLQVDDGSPADVSQVDLQCAAGEAEDTSLDGDTTLAAGEELDLIVTSVANTPTWVSICWTFNWVD